ncbi:MAG TPA: nucleotidyltransferase family protein [Longimicrobiales bacterium]|nr:nucleotidyltransferase family protein [Longimicrobiales bacterium]
MRRIYGIVLAAGHSSRMGSPKPLLEAGGETLVEGAVRALAGGGCAAVLVVVRDASAPEAALASAAGARVVVSDAPGAEQVDSLRRALDVLPGDAGAAIVLPVDHPGVSGATVAAVVEAWRAREAPIVRPVHDGVPGHPTLFDQRLFGELRAPELPEGARTVVAHHEGEAEDVSVADAAVARDVDTPEELGAARARLRGRR